MPLHYAVEYLLSKIRENDNLAKIERILVHARRFVIILNHDLCSSQNVHPLDYAMNHLQSAELTRLLLQQTSVMSRYFDLNAQNPLTGRTALMNAIASNNLAMVQLFVESALIQKLLVDLILHDSEGNDIFQVEQFKPFKCCICMGTNPKDQAAQLPCAHKNGVCRDCEGRIAQDNNGFKSCPKCRQSYV